jgi:hypothetical protein
MPVMLATSAIVVAVAGCATAPSGGSPRRAAGGGSQVQAYVQPLPPPAPTSASAWSPTAVVLGFLHASASYAVDPAAARRYLVPSANKKWHPDNRPVAVVGNKPNGISQVPYLPHAPGTNAGEQLETVKYTGQQLATLSQTGQYQYRPAQNVQYEFILARTNGVWLIQELPQGQPGLLLTESDFEEVYQARNLFFYAPTGPSQSSGVLVPDPVYAPLQSSNSALNTNLATGLVNGLLKGQGDWLSGATWSAFPRGTSLIGQVTISGRTARVDLGGRAAHATGLQIEQMAAQLRATLGDGSYSSPLASQVQLYINNSFQDAGPASSAASLVTDVPVGPLLVVTGTSGVGQLPAAPRPRTIPTVVLSAAQLGRAQITAIAAAPTLGRSPQIAVAVQDRAGCSVYLNDVGQPYRSVVLTTSGGTCTSLSWDNNGNLWATAGHAVWVLRPHSLHPIAVGMAALFSDSQSGNPIVAMRMAPDDVRAALLVRTKAGNKLLLAAVRFDASDVSFRQAVTIGTGVADPTAVSWLDAYHVAVLAGGAILSVPLTGGAGLQPGGSPQPLGTAPPGAQTLTTDGADLVAGTADGHIFASSLRSPGWLSVTTGWNPVYPG